MPNPHAGVVDAAGQAAAAYSPDNAIAVLDWYDHMEEMIHAVGQMLHAQGTKTTQEFFMYPAAASFAAELGSRLGQFAGVVKEARDAFYGVHKEDIDKIRNPQPYQAKWDIGANQ